MYSAMNPTMVNVRHFNVIIGEHVRSSPLINKKVKSEGITVSNHLLVCTHSASLERFKNANQGKQKICIGNKRKSPRNER